MDQAVKDAYAKVLAELRRERSGIDRAMAAVRRLMGDGAAAEPAAETVAASTPPALTARPLAMDLEPGGREAAPPASAPPPSPPGPPPRPKPPWEMTVTERAEARRAAAAAEAPPEPEPPPAAPPPPSGRPTNASLGITTQMADVIDDVAAMLAEGPMTAAAIAERLTREGKPVRSLQVSMALRHRPETFADAGMTDEATPRALYRLRDTAERIKPFAGIRLDASSPAKSQAEEPGNRNLLAAAVSVLKRSRKPMLASEIAEAMEAAGVRFPPGVDATLSIGTMLGRNAGLASAKEVTFVKREGGEKKTRLWQAVSNEG